jgi:outer membrane immunogenic protein
VRGRLGYAWDTLLVYATGGVAFTDRDRNNGDDFTGFGGFGIPSGGSLVGTGFYVNPAAAFAGNLVAPTNAFFLTDDRKNNNVGWTVGGGVEWAFAPNWTAKIEGLYVAFDREQTNDNGFLLSGNVVGVSNTGAPVTAGQLGIDNRRDREDFGVVRVGVNYKFGTY